jgi:predicted flap endonuclease-1-like 5' DNA nuclease
MTTQLRPALQFDGIDDYVDCGDNPAHALDSTFTLEAWIYVESWRPRAGILTKHLDAHGDEAGYALQLGAQGNLRLALRAVDGDRVEVLSSPADSLPQQQWHHVAGTFDGTLMRLYIDGTPVGEQEPAGPALGWFPRNKLFIALTRDGDDVDVFFHGMIGQVRIWDRAKSGDELRAGMDRRAAAEDPGLVGSWPLDAAGAGDGAQASDESSTGQDGTVQGGAHSTDSEVPFPEAAKPRPQAASRADILGTLDLDFYRAGSIDREYVVLSNNSGEAIDLSGLSVVVPTAMKRVKNEGKNAYAFAPAVVLASGASLVIRARGDGCYSFDSTLPLFYSSDGLVGYVDTVDLIYQGKVVKSRSKTTGDVDDLPEDPLQGPGKPVTSPPPEPDNLAKIEGIGPKTNDLLQAANIRTYAQLAATTINDLQKILDDGGRRYSLLDPGTWAEQAALAAAGEWKQLRALQDELDGGVRA